MKSRLCRVPFEKFRDDGYSLDDLVTVGKFHPFKSIILYELTENEAHFLVKGLPDWGVTYPTRSIPRPSKEGIRYGYFHIHRQNNERVYLNIAKEDDFNLIPCYECVKAIEAQW